MVHWKEVLVSFAVTLIVSWVADVWWLATYGGLMLVPPVFIVSWIFLYYWFRKRRKDMPI